MFKKQQVTKSAARADYLQGVPCGGHAKAESLVKRWLAVVTAHSGLLLDDPFLGGNVHHVQLHVEVCQQVHDVSNPRQDKAAKAEEALVFGSHTF